MSQNDFSIANQGFPSFRSDLNSALQALASNSSGTSAPSTTYAYQWWYDETSDILKIRNGANDAWIDFATFDQTTDTWSFASLDVTGDLTVDTNTLFVDASADSVGINNASPSASLDVTGDVAISSDLTVDTDTLYVDSASNRVGIGTSSPENILHLASTSGPHIVFQDNDAGGNKPSIGTEGAAGSLIYTNGGTSASHIFKLNRGASEAMRIDNSGNVGIGTSSPSDTLHVEASDPKIRLTDSDTGAYHQINAQSSNGGLAIDYDAGADSANSFLLFRRAGTQEAMRIDSSGNVGIGTSSPSATLDVNGSLSKNSGSFKIDHPVKPDTHHLVHSFVEGPQADNLYRGKVTLVDGFAVVNLDQAGRMSEGTFVALNGNVQCWTTNEGGWTQVRGQVKGNILTIEAQDPACTDEVSWLVIGERKDQHMLDTEWTDENGRVITEPAKEQSQ